MRFYTVEALRKNLGEILDRIRFSNESVTVTKRKKPIVTITAIEESLASEPVIGTAPPALPEAAAPKRGKS